LFPHHQELLGASAIAPDVARERGYVSVDTQRRLEVAGYSKTQCRVPGLLIPVRDVTGEVVGYEYRPDHPRVTDTGRVLKYEKPYGAVNHLDIPVRINGALNDPSVP